MLAEPRMLQGNVEGGECSVVGVWLPLHLHQTGSFVLMSLTDGPMGSRESSKNYEFIPGSTLFGGLIGMGCGG